MIRKLPCFVFFALALSVAAGSVLAQDSAQDSQAVEREALEAAADAPPEASGASGAAVAAGSKPTVAEPRTLDIPRLGEASDAALAAANDLESFVDAMPVAERLADWHERFSSEPHLAGSDGDRRLIEKMASYLESLKLEVETHRFSAYLARPVGAQLQIVGASAELPEDVAVFGPLAPLPLGLPLRERIVEENPYSRNPDLLIGWNAYSGSGQVTAPVVYANYGTREDFERLSELGIEVGGKIVLARYGGNFRGFKAKFAAQAGAAGLILFTDPKDSGYFRGPTYPEGGWANASYIQRGSLLTLPYPGDPLTPFVEASADAERLEPGSVALPKIPVQPIGWGAAFEILRRMRGGTVPPDWQGGLPLTYRLEGGEELRVRLQVEQRRELMETANVVAFLPGTTSPDEWVVIGSHHDAWSFGAGDPNSGSILVFEAARAFAAAAARGFRPARTLVFANWGAEEFGIIGSTEWVEGRRDELLEKAVAYINLDGAAMGIQFQSSASPSLKRVIAEVTRQVPQARSPESTVFDAWRGEQSEPSFGNLGGGSDHVGFYCHLGVPSAGLSAGGSPGVSYHSNYEDLHWYHQVVGDDYQGARMLARLVVRLAARLADDPLLPLDPARYGLDFKQHAETIRARAAELGFDLASPDGKAPGVLEVLEQEAAAYAERAASVDARVRQAVAEGRLGPEQLRAANRLYRQLERRWLFAEGLPERPWFRNLYAATDPDSGYGAWMLPGLRWVVEKKATPALALVLEAYRGVLSQLQVDLGSIEALIPAVPQSAVQGQAPGAD